MATTVFFQGGVGNTQRAQNTNRLDGSATSWIARALTTSRGGSLNTLTTNTVAGPTSGVEVTDGAGATERVEWISNPVSADVTISGTITANIWVAESNMSANVAINVDIFKMSGLDGSLTRIVTSTRVTEEAVTTRAAANFTTGMTSGSYTGVSLNRGDRILIRIFADDVGTMGSGFTYVIGYSGPTAAADGDSFVTFTETFSFDALASNTQKLYFTKTASAADSAVLDTGWLTPGTVTNVDRAGANAWSGTGNVAAVDTTYATVSSATTGTDYLRCQNFGISLPASAIVRGLAAEIIGHTASGARSISLHMLDPLGNPAEEDSGFGTITTGADQTKTYGGQDYYWKAPPEANHLVKATVEDVDFGIDIWCPDTTADTISIDQVRIKVFYSQVYRQLEAWTSKGAGVTPGGHTAALNGWTTTGYIIGANDPSSNFTGLPGGGVEWLTRPLQAFTLGGSMKFNFWCAESNTNGNASIRVEVAVVSNDGVTRTLWGTGWLSNQGGADTFGELPTTEAALAVWVMGDDVSVSDGQRLSFRFLVDDTSNAAITNLPKVTFNYAGVTDSASGDSWVFLPVTLTEFVAADPLNANFMRNRRGKRRQGVYIA